MPVARPQNTQGKPRKQIIIVAAVHQKRLGKNPTRELLKFIAVRIETAARLRTDEIGVLADCTKSG